VSITNGIPDGTLVWRIVQDHINPNLLFLATEYGVYVSLNQGGEWHKFSTGLPTISVRDLAIQKRENDLVLATFGRSFYVLDDYSPLRDIKAESLQQSAILFKPRKALQYHQIRGGTSSQGGSFYTAENPKYGAMFTFYLKEGHITLKSARQKSEKDKKTADIPFPGWKALDAEKNESKPQLILVIVDEAGEVVDRIYAPHKKGVQRVNWDLKQPYISVADANAKRKMLNTLRLDVEPGNYTVRLHQQIDGKITAVTGPQIFEVDRIRKNILENPIADQRDEFIEKLVALDKAIDIANHSFEKSSKHLKTLLKSLPYVDSSQEDLSSKLHSLRELMNEIKRFMEGSSSKAEVGEKDDLTLSYRLYFAASGLNGNSYGPTPLHMKSFEVAENLFAEINPMITSFVSAVDAVSSEMEAAGAPVVLD
ncbi:glycosyl hydrolase, partial [Flavobacteriaceae bacterium]|nr:glycosyl hydrolase [Flavobacteriaceae bacterium]